MKFKENIPGFFFAGLIASCICNSAASAQGQGSVCLVPGFFDEFAKGGATVEAEAANERQPKPSTTSESVRFVRIDELPAAKVTSSKPGKISGIGTARRHLVKISRNSDMTQPLARFRFSFREHRSDKLCLWYESFYGSWRLQKGSFCHCK